MSVDGSGPLRRSLEVEYWVVDGEGRLVEPDGLVGAAEGTEREFVEPILEVKTSPCETTAELREELYERLGAVLRRADELDRGLVPLATPMCEETVGELDSERTRIQNRIVGDDFRYVRHCAGTHIHVEQRPGREIDQLNALVAIDPALALANTSPYFDGRRLAAGARSKLYRRMAYDDVPHQGWLWRYAGDTREWSRRLERRFEEFLTAAVDAGVDRTDVESNFSPESAVWTPVQLRERFSTVEWRSPDNALPSEVLRLADDVAGFVERLDGAELRIDGETGSVSDEMVVAPEFDAVLKYVDAAIEEGLESEAVRSYLDRMGFDVDAYSPVTHEIDGRETVSPEEAREIRLEHAERLERDVRSGGRRSGRSGQSARERTD
ncbi:glutamate-cysteine ligase family protein [Halogeometricum sp. S3BR5-2]|uniref:Glutamate-cysteine ligase family protein n=1 Tax=Halogeometricum luteum TaxID=2950537 RepID=A0ABU2FYG3_9EURY|nr:glutamate-cysteine ligase family protein [Halogeometricum sp. S3BR5-2]MDS0293566.1 glutamate-cysteine ligase family protein [Halogeometricum sp. S3BR5-2]